MPATPAAPAGEHDGGVLAGNSAEREQRNRLRDGAGERQSLEARHRRVTSSPLTRFSKTGPKRMKSAALWRARAMSAGVWQETLTIGEGRPRVHEERAHLLWRQLVGCDVR